MVNTNTPTSRTFILPDLISLCPFTVKHRENSESLCDESDRWLDVRCPNLTEKSRRKLYGLKAGQLAAYTYPHSDDNRFRVAGDFLNILFHLDDVSDGMMKKDTVALADVVMNVLRCPGSVTDAQTLNRLDEIAAVSIVRDFWTRLVRDGGPRCQARFSESFSKYFKAVHLEVQARENGTVPDLKDYPDMSRDLSACKPCFDLIEYVLGIDLPDFVVANPVIMALNDIANDLIIWANDLYSYNVEQARGDTHNLLCILMKHNGLDLQGAADYMGAMWSRGIESFYENKMNVPSWGPEIDRDVAKYIQGLEDWIVGNLHWSFLTERYLGKDGPRIKESRVVRLLTKQVPRNAA